jgi:GT2 family glycosyltransferase
MSSALARVAVVVVDWNTTQLLERCLASLARQTLPPERVIVVDNAGDQPSWRHVRDAPLRTDLVRLSANRGFAAANNVGLGLAEDCDWVALLNPDAFPEPDWLEHLVAAAGQHPGYSFFASRLLNAEDPELLDGTGDVYAVSGLAYRRDHGLPACGVRLLPEEVFGPCAAAALYRREALLEVGGFDERFFCFFEDVDLAFRLRLAGHRCLYVPEAIVHHVGSATTVRHSTFSVYHAHRNLVWTFVKNMPGPLLARYLAHHLLLNLVSLAYFAAMGQGRPILRAKWDALRGLPRALVARQAIQSRRRVSVGQLLRLMVGGRRAFGVGRFEH